MTFCYDINVSIQSEKEIQIDAAKAPGIVCQALGLPFEDLVRAGVEVHLTAPRIDMGYPFPTVPVTPMEEYLAQEEAKEAEQPKEGAKEEPKPAETEQKPTAIAVKKAENDAVKAENDAEELPEVTKAALRDILIRLREDKSIESVRDLYKEHGAGASSMKDLKPEHYAAMYLAAKAILEG